MRTAKTLIRLGGSTVLHGVESDQIIWLKAQLRPAITPCLVRTKYRDFLAVLFTFLGSAVVLIS